MSKKKRFLQQYHSAISLQLIQLDTNKLLDLYFKKHVIITPTNIRKGAKCMNFALQTELSSATVYFNDAIKKVYVHQGTQITPFSAISYRPQGEECYNLSAWALMGLDPDARLLRGTIDLPELPEWKAQKNYLTGWVEFYYNGEEYIYDPLKAFIYHASVWREIHNPRNITFNRSQSDILDIILNENYDFAYRLSDSLWQIKAETYLPDGLTSETSGCLNNALKLCQISRYFRRVNFCMAFRSTEL